MNPETMTCAWCVTQQPWNEARAFGLPYGWARNPFSGTVLCGDCFPRAWTCLGCSEWFLVEDLTLERCESCFEVVGTRCHGCAEPMYQDDTFEGHDGHSRCASCHRSYRRRPVESGTFDRFPYRRSIGFELEFIADNEPDVEDWGELHDDGSVEPSEGRGGCSMEFSSFPFAGDRLLDVIPLVCRAISRQNAYTNRTCGFHVHLDVSRDSDEQRANIRAWWLVFERLFQSIVAPSRSRNHYCRRVPYMKECDDRYLTLNTSARLKWGTYEVRLHHGTVYASQVTEWITFLASFFDTFRDVTWNKERETEVSTLTQRGRLVFLFQQMRLPLSLRKTIIRRHRRYNGEARYSLRKAA